MKILIDLQAVQTASYFRGIGRYSFSLLFAMLKQNKEHEINILMNSTQPELVAKIKTDTSEFISQENIYIFQVDESLTTETSEIIREFFIAQLSVNVVLIMSLFDTISSIGMLTQQNNVAVIVYDLIPLIKKESYLKTKWDLKFYLRKVEFLKKSTALLAISQHTKQEIIDELNIVDDKIHVINSGVADNFKPIKMLDDEKIVIKHKFNIKDKFILFSPGGFDERKNFKKLIEAYSLLSISIRKNYQLVITSKISKEYLSQLEKFANSVGLSKTELVLTNYLEEEDLIKLYNLATLFVFPSLHEGFGLPVLEAMACGCPTLGSNLTSIPEVIEREDALFNPTSAKSIAEKITKALSNEKWCLELQKHGLKQTKKFSWDKTAKMTFNVLEQIALKTPIATPHLENVFEKIIQHSDKSISDNTLKAIANNLAANEIKK